MENALMPERIKPVRKLTWREIDALHSAVEKLTNKLYKARFGRDLEPWDGSDFSAFDKFMFISRMRTVEEIEPLLTNYFASDMISDARPGFFLNDNFSRYRIGPLESRGFSKTQLAEERAAQEREFAKAMEEAQRKQNEIANEDASQRLQRATYEVVKDLRRQGYDAFENRYPSSCHLLAIPNTANTAKATALRIVVSTNKDDVSRRTNVCEAVVTLGQYRDDLAQITYLPKLEKLNGR